MLPFASIGIPTVILAVGILTLFTWAEMVCERAARRMPLLRGAGEEPGTATQWRLSKV